MIQHLLFLVSSRHHIEIRNKTNKWSSYQTSRKKITCRETNTKTKAKIFKLFGEKNKREIIDPKRYVIKD